MTLQNSNAGSNNNLTNDAMKVEDLSFIIPRASLANDKDNYSATFANANEEKMNKANAKSFFMKRIGKKNFANYYLARLSIHADARLLVWRDFRFIYFPDHTNGITWRLPKNSRI